MGIGRRVQKEDGQARTAAEQGMHAIAQQQGTRMLSGSMPKGGVRITASPSQDGSTVNNEITSPNEPPSNGLQNCEDEERFVQRGSSCAATFALLRWAGNAQVLKPFARTNDK
jgi:hypothetical protein